jgi:hypothetical protein
MIPLPTTSKPKNIRLLSVGDAAHYLGRTECAIRNLIWAAKVPYVRIDRRIFLDIQDLDEFIEQHKVLDKL